MAELEKGSAKLINFDVHIFAAVDEHYQGRGKKNSMVIHFLPKEDDDFDQDLVQHLVTESGRDQNNVKASFTIGFTSTEWGLNVLAADLGKMAFFVAPLARLVLGRAHRVPALCGHSFHS